VQGLISASQTDVDIVGFYRESVQVEFVVLFSRGGVIIEKSEFYFDNANLEDDEILREFLAQYYGVERFIPHEILIPIDFDGLDVFGDWLSDKHAKRFRLTVPKRGAKIKLLEMARRNAEECFKRKMAEIQSELHLLQDIKKALCLTKIPERIECFDISNIQGRDAVASMVRFSKGKHEKRMYKRFRINTINGSNDYGMMYEVLSRRFKKHDQSNWELPDLVLIDGGKGQLNIAHQVLEELGLSGRVNLASIAKGREEGEQDKIYIPGRKNPILLSMSSRELLYLMRVRDEAHRFAITYHKKLRIKKALQSALDFIPGIGIKRKILLLRHFKTVSEIKNASIEELVSIPGINLTVANMLKQQLNI
jgi:excinuclease ABC subunit C